jgi:hypothetical protein
VTGNGQIITIGEQLFAERGIMAAGTSARPGAMI